MDLSLPRLSFGCEFEFVLAYLPTWQKDPHEGCPGLSPLLRTTRLLSRDEATEIIEHIRNTLKTHGISVHDPTTTIEDETVPKRLRHTDMWDVTIDGSVTEPNFPEYEWQDIEVRSPAFLVREDAYREVEYVLNLLKASYRLRVNSSAGFHVHVGNGTDWFPTATLRGLGAILWAADPLLSRLHAPWRRAGAYSNSLRYESVLACYGNIVTAELAETMKTQRPGDEGNITPTDQGWPAHDQPWSSENDYVDADNHGAQEWNPTIPDEHPVSSDIEAVPAGTEGSETVELTTEHMMWLVRNLPDLETRMSFMNECINAFGHYDVHLLTDNQLYTVLLRCAPGIDDGENISPWTEILDQWIRYQPTPVDLWHSQPERPNGINASNIIKNFEDLLAGMKQQIAPDGTIQYVRKLGQGGTPDTNIHTEGLLRALNNYAKSSESVSQDGSQFDPDVVLQNFRDRIGSDQFCDNFGLMPDGRSQGEPWPQQSEGINSGLPESSPIKRWGDDIDDDDRSSFLSHVTPTQSWETSTSRGDYIPPAYKAFLDLYNENAPEPSTQGANEATQYTTTSENSDNGGVSNSINSSRYDSSPFISQPESEQWNDDDHHSDSGSAVDLERHEKQHTAITTTRGRTKLRPHDVTLLTKSYMEDPTKENCNWKRIGWVPTAANRVDPAGVHERGDEQWCRECCPDHPSTTLREGVGELLSCHSTQAIGTLLTGFNSQRLNYNFRNYAPSHRGWDGENIRTVEFREAGGTLDAGWAVVWAKICVGVADWCRKAPPLQLLEVVDRLAEQEDRDQSGVEQSDEERYDVCDFLDDLCLFAEAEFVRQREAKYGPPL